MNFTKIFFLLLLTFIIKEELIAQNSTGIASEKISVETNANQGQKSANFQVGYKIKRIINKDQEKSLDLSSLNIEHLTYLKSSDTVETLILKDNNLTSEELMNLKDHFPNLKKLDLSRNNIKDLNFLNNLTKLERLDVSGNPLDDLVIENHSSLKEFIFMSKPGYFKRFSFKNLPFLETIYITINRESLSGSPIYPKTPFELSFLPKLKTLYMDGVDHYKFYLEGKFSSLKYLTYRHAGVRYLHFIYFFPNIEVLNLSYNDIDELEPLEFLKKLKILDLTFNPLNDLPENLSSVLETIALDRTSVGSLHSLLKIASLKNIYADSCPQITKMIPDNDPMMGKKIISLYGSFRALTKEEIKTIHQEIKALRSIGFEILSDDF